MGSPPSTHFFPIQASSFSEEGVKEAEKSLLFLFRILYQMREYSVHDDCYQFIIHAGQLCLPPPPLFITAERLPLLLIHGDRHFGSAAVMLTRGFAVYC